MKNKVILPFLLILIFSAHIDAQNLNTITGSVANIIASTPVNAPESNHAILGMQNTFDANYMWQFVNVHNTDNYYLRRYVYGWSNYYKIWHSGNFNPNDTINTPIINVNSPASSSPINSLNINVASFGTSSNASNSSYLKIRDLGSNTTHFLIRGDGNVGIGTSMPGVKLDVIGTIRAQEVKVCLNQGCDYVFENDYDLLSINELASFIKQNKHLPDISPAEEMESNGISLSEMNAKLLKKIEEQSLYIIDLNNQIQEIKKQVDQLKKLN